MCDQAPSTSTFPRVGEIQFHDTEVSIWEDWSDDPSDDWSARDTRRQGHFRGVDAAFKKLLDHLRVRGFTTKPDSIYRSCGVVGRKGDLEFAAHVSGRTAEVRFFQNVANVENPNGGRHDFNKFLRMPRDLRLRCAVELIQLIRAMQAMGYTFGPKSDLSEPLPRAVLRKAERREEEGLTPLDRYNRQCWPDQRRTAWQTPEELDRTRQSYDRRDGDGALLCNGDVRYFYDWTGRLARGQVFYTSGNCWPVYLPDGTWLSRPGNYKLFSTDRPDLLPRRQVKGTQVCRVSRELQAARALRDRLLGSPQRRLNVKALPGCLAWLAPVVWAAAVATQVSRVGVLEGVLARLSKGEQGYYVWSIKNSPEECLSFFGPNDSGYPWRLSDSGRYQESKVKEHQGYYDNEEHTIAVPCEAVEALVNAKGCVPNTTQNKRALLEAAGRARKARGQSSLKAAARAEKKARKASQEAA